MFERVEYESTMNDFPSSSESTVIRWVNRLPTEVTVLADVSAFLRARAFHRHLPLMHTTHVCCHWGDTDSSTPSSWTWINPKWGELGGHLKFPKGRAVF